MSDHPAKQDKKHLEVFSKRIDFYWKFTTIYALALLFYVFFKGSVSGDMFSATIVFNDPLFILLSLFTIASCIGMLIGIFKNHVVIIGKDYIVFKTRFLEKKYTLGDIVSIKFGRKRITRLPSAYRVVKIKVLQRRRLIRIRPSSFWNEKELMESIVELKHRLGNN